MIANTPFKKKLRKLGKYHSKLAFDVHLSNTRFLYPEQKTLRYFYPSDRSDEKHACTDAQLSSDKCIKCMGYEIRNNFLI